MEDIINNFPNKDDLVDFVNKIFIFVNFCSVHSYNVVVDVRCSYAIKSNCAQFNFVFVVLLFL